jgi:hypothetical protein
VLLPKTLLETVPDDEVLPLVPPVEMLTLMPLALVLVPVVVTSDELRTEVEQDPRQAADALLTDVPVESEADVLTWLRAPSPLANTGADAMSVKAETAAIHTIVLRFISSSCSSQTSWPDLSIVPEGTPCSP